MRLSIRPVQANNCRGPEKAGLCLNACKNIERLGKLCLILFLLFQCIGMLPRYAVAVETDSSDTRVSQWASTGAADKKKGYAPADDKGVEVPSDEYGNVSEEEVGGVEGPSIADPIESWNRAIHGFNDTLYFSVLKPVTEVYKLILNEDFRGLVSGFYQNVKAPIRIVNNLLQWKPGYAGLETIRFIINSTFGVGGLKDCAKECFGIEGRDADFGQTLGKYGVGPGFYIVWPFLGPSSPRDSVGWVADRALNITSYISPGEISVQSLGTAVGLYVHDTVNALSFHIGDYETLKSAAIDPYVAIRDAYIQNRKAVIEKK